MSMYPADLFRLPPGEELWLSQQAVDHQLAVDVYDRFHEAFASDTGRDYAEFRRLLASYQAGSPDYRAGVDLTVTALTGYRLLTLLKRAKGIPEDGGEAGA